MLKSLEKLKNGISVTFYADGIEEEIRREIAAEIQAEVDKFYLPRPLFEDGEPVRVGDEVADEMGVFTVERICYGPSKYCLEGGNHFMYLTMDTRVSRPPEPDTQEKIDADYHEMKVNLFRAASQCGIDRDGVRRIVNEFDAIWARQRKLDGVE